MDELRLIYYNVYNRVMALAIDKHDRGHKQTKETSTNCKSSSHKDQCKTILKADDHPKDENS
jgi:hypothetical protein